MIDSKIPKNFYIPVWLTEKEYKRLLDTAVKVGQPINETIIKLIDDYDRVSEQTKF